MKRITTIISILWIIVGTLLLSYYNYSFGHYIGKKLHHRFDLVYSSSIRMDSPLVIRMVFPTLLSLKTCDLFFSLGFHNYYKELITFQEMP